MYAEEKRIYRTECGDVRVGYLTKVRVGGSRTLFTFVFYRAGVRQRCMIRADNERALWDRLALSYGIIQETRNG